MSEIIEGILKAIELIVTGNPTVVEITVRSLLISGTATFLSVIWSFPIAMLIGLKSFFGKRFLKGIFHALLGMPTVLLGLILYLIFAEGSILSALGILYNPIGMILGEAILVTPIVISLVISSVEAVDPEIKDLAKTLGASEFEASIAVVKESTGGILLAVIASFNRAIAELGIAMMLGGNIRHFTSVLTTTIALETGKGDLPLAIALGIILMLIVFSISLATNLLQRKQK